MDGFKNTTKTQYFAGGDTDGPRGAAKISQTMKAFKDGTLHSGKKPVRKASGGRVLPVDPDHEDAGVMRLPAEPPAARPPRPGTLASVAAAKLAAERKAVAPRTPLDLKLSTLPSQRGEMPIR